MCASEGAGRSGRPQSGDVECVRKRLAGKLALVTGASRGIGAAVAKCLGRAGAHLILLARTQGALEEVDDALRSSGAEPPTLVVHDLRDFSGIDCLGARIFARFGRLDILASIAGHLEGLSPVGHITPQSWQRTLDVNLTANYRMLRSLDPLLRRSACGRVVFATAPQASRHDAYWASYAASKAGLEALVRSYAAEVRKTGICVNLMDPGRVATSLRARAFPGEDPKTLPTPEEVAEAFLPLLCAEHTRSGEIVRFGNDVGTVRDCAAQFPRRSAEQERCG